MSADSTGFPHARTEARGSSLCILRRAAHGTKVHTVSIEPCGREERSAAVIAFHLPHP
jgi:hypothetical protein